MRRQLSSWASGILLLICLSLVLFSLAGCGGAPATFRPASIPAASATQVPAPSPVPTVTATPTASSQSAALASFNDAAESTTSAAFIGNPTLTGDRKSTRLNSSHGYI